MKVLLVGNYAPDEQQSMLLFASVLERELRARGHDVRLLQPRARLNRRGLPPRGRAKWLGYLDKFVLFLPELRRAARGADVVHICDHSNAPYVRVLGRSPHLVTCNDVLAIRSARGLVPHNPTGWSGKLLQKIILSGLNRARHVACISENTRRELLEVASLAPERSRVIYMGLNFPYAPMPHDQARSLVSSLLSQRAEDVLRRGFVFHVGGNLWYKNRLGVLRIYENSRRIRRKEAASFPVLVMAGQPFTDEMQQLIAERNLNDDVIGVTGASNQQLQALYSLAQAFLFPSLAEGFGWPVVEAQACGCRVLTSNRAPLTEIGGNAALYCDPENEMEAARQLNSLLDEAPDARDARVEMGLQNAARFSTSTMIEAYEATYTEIRHAHKERTRVF